MNVWGYLGVGILCVTAFILVLAVLYVLIVTWFAHRNSHKVLDKQIHELEKLLPGKNCGACGCETCVEYARAVFSLYKDTDRCPHGGETLKKQLDERMEKISAILENDTPSEKDLQERRF
jgi:Na+-translocating ferredoxin:NAD+ oxidoreductase RNF subunit RnfB